MHSIVNASCGIMAANTGDQFLKLRLSYINPMSFIADMAADLLLTIGFVIITIAFIYIPSLSGSIIRMGLGIAMLLFVPGYAIVSMLFPAKENVRGMWRAVLSFALSIAIVPMIGLFLNYTDWGVHLNPTLACVTILTLFCVLIANKRRHDIPDEARFSIGLKDMMKVVNDSMPSDKTKADKALTIMTVVVVLLTVYMTAYVMLLPGQDRDYTEFYLLGPNGTTENYPYKFILGDEKTVLVGIANHENRNVTYDLVINLNDLNNSTVKNLYSERLTLPESDVSETPINVTPDMVGINMKMDFLLYIDGNTTAPYKECYLWVNVTNPTPRPTMRPMVTVRPTIKPTTNVVAGAGINYNGSIVG